MSQLDRDLVFIILQFLREEKYTDTAHKLEQESGLYFDLLYLEELVRRGEWDEVEKYLSGFTKVHDNEHSAKIFFEIRKQKYLEALDKSDREKATDILLKELKVFSTYDAELYKDLTQLITFQNFRECKDLSVYKDTEWGRSLTLSEVKRSIRSNPLFQDKLQYTSFKNSRLRTLISQSFNWQHHLCQNTAPIPEFTTLFTDHKCTQQSGAHSPNLLMSAKPSSLAFMPSQASPFVLIPNPFAMSRVPLNLESSSYAAMAARKDPTELSRPIGRIPEKFL